MKKMTKQNLQNIMDRFQRETGTSLYPERSFFSVRKVLLVAVLTVMGILLAAFSAPLFSPLDGDELSVEGTYLGDGIVSVRVENGSDKVLTFTDAKLFSWNDGEVEMLSGGKVILSQPRVEPHGEGIMTVDLSGAYDIDFLENTTPGKPKDSWYYLLLTNQSFLFGHDWMCSFSFGEEAVLEETEPTHIPEGKAQNLDGVEEELAFYFARSYFDVIPAFNEANFTYQQKVEELLMRTPGTWVRPADVPLFLKDPDGTVDQRYSSLDAYNRMVGSSFSGVTSDFVLQISGSLPEKGEAAIPLVFFAVYETALVQQENAYTFLYGRILSFDKLKMVYEGEGYTVFDVTDLYYRDLESYVRDLTGKIEADDYQTLEAVREYYRNPDNLEFKWMGPEM